MTRGLIHISNQDAAGGFGGRGRVRLPRPPGGDDPWYSDPVTVRKVDANSTATTVTNTGTETTISSLTLPSLILATTGAARLTSYGTVGKNTGGAETVVFRLKVADQSGSTETVLSTTSVNLGTSTALHPWGLEVMFLGKQPSVNRVGGIMDIGTAGAGASLLASTYSSVGFSTMGLDETDEWTVYLTAQMSAASTAFSVTRQFSVLEGVN